MRPSPPCLSSPPKHAQIQATSGLASCQPMSMRCAKSLLSKARALRFRCHHFRSWSRFCTCLPWWERACSFFCISYCRIECLAIFLVASQTTCKSSTTSGPGRVAKLRRTLGVLGAMEGEAGRTIDLAAQSARLSVRRTNGHPTIGTDRFGAAAAGCTERVFEALNFDDSAIAHRVLPLNGPELYHSGFRQIIGSAPLKPADLLSVLLERQGCILMAPNV